MTPLARARLSLEGLSVGDAFGEQLFGENAVVLQRLEQRDVRPPPWTYTDDTEMALSIFDMLRETGEIDRDALAQAFAKRMTYARGYGKGAYELLEAVRGGAPWKSASANLFRGKGSFGNGAAMRIAPLGAYFSDDLTRVVAEAHKASEVTHAHPEGIAGGVAVAVAAALAWNERESPKLGSAFVSRVADEVPVGYTKDGLLAAERLSADAPYAHVVETLGNGAAVTAADTVPLCVWIVAHATSFEEALWQTAGALGDRDTTCAIVGGILALRFGDAAIPAPWRAAREKLPLDP